MVSYELNVIRKKLKTKFRRPRHLPGQNGNLTPFEQALLQEDKDFSRKMTHPNRRPSPNYPIGRFFKTRIRTNSESREVKKRYKRRAAIAWHPSYL